MAITKAAKVEAEIEKVKGKISESQTRLRELEQKKTEIENTEIVGVVRGMSISIEELATMLQAIKSNAAAPVSTSGHHGQKSGPAPASDAKEDDEE